MGRKRKAKMGSRWGRHSVLFQAPVKSQPARVFRARAGRENLPGLEVAEAQRLAGPDRDPARASLPAGAGRREHPNLPGRGRPGRRPPPFRDEPPPHAGDFPGTFG